MSKIPNYSSKELLKILKKRGFKIDHITGSHYILRHLITKQRVTLPYHTKNLPKGTILSILKQADILK
ncbi:type II toxin-antitoxin system HicA family toxin [Candidatus Kuenenbacteria bacterium]|nr:type II toxin-antitoxin system HicA family toxin [Candidatus Kuenenbacteria bacterium]